MATCQNCKTELPEGTAFCPSCGTKTAAVETPTAATGSKKLHCPQCGSHNISITTESSVNSAVSTHHGGVSSTHVSNTHRNYWMCSDCGAKFRNIQNLEEEIAKSKKTPIAFFILAIIAAIIAIYFFSKGTGMFGFLYTGYKVASVFAAIMFVCLALYSKSKLKKMQAELEYLKKNCF